MNKVFINHSGQYKVFIDSSGQYKVYAYHIEYGLYVIGETNFEYSDLEAFKKVCSNNNMGYYARPKENFFLSEAEQLKKSGGFFGVFVEDMS